MSSASSSATNGGSRGAYLEPTAAEKVAEAAKSASAKSTDKPQQVETFLGSGAAKQVTNRTESPLATAKGIEAVAQQSLQGQSSSSSSSSANTTSSAAHLTTTNQADAHDPVLKSRERYDKAFEKLPKEDMFRMFIDKNRQDEGEDTFDIKEPGYKQGMQNAFNYIRDSIGKKLDADEYCKIHDCCVDGVSYTGKRKQFSKGFAALSIYDITMANVTEDAEKEWKSEKLIWQPSNEDMTLYLSYKMYGFPVQSFADDKDEFKKAKEKINGLIDNYYKSIEKATTDKEKIAAIAKLCRALEIYHIFSDGNQRTTAFALLNKLLIENNLSPCILDDPIVFDGYHSEKELVEDIENGMANFQAFCQST